MPTEPEVSEHTPTTLRAVGVLLRGWSARVDGFAQLLEDYSEVAGQDLAATVASQRAYDRAKKDITRWLKSLEEAITDSGTAAGIFGRPTSSSAVPDGTDSARKSRKPRGKRG